jgi:hypothetical protein
LQLETVRLVIYALVEVMLVPDAAPKVRRVTFRFEEVALVNTPVLGVVAPIGVFSIVPPLIVSASATLLSPSDPVIEPNDPRASVTLALPSVPELTAVAETLPVASIVSVLDTMASVIELAGSATEEVTFNAPTFAAAMLELEIVVVRKEEVALNVFKPVNVLLPFK